MAASKRARSLGLALMFASGFAALGYQIVWTQQAALWLGHEAAAVLAVLAAFFAGLALGALGLGRRIERSARPERWYAGCEAAMAAWGIALAMLIAPVGAALLALIGVRPSPLRHWAVSFGGTFLLLLPATAAMGATLPAMARVLDAGRCPRALGPLYAMNTFGGVAGVLACAFWLVPAHGLVRTAMVCAALNLACAAAALALRQPPAEPLPLARGAGASRLALVLAATGFLGIGYEVLAVRVLSQVTENTVYTFAMLLAVYLVGTALGAAGYHLALRDRRAPERLADRLLQFLVATCVLGALGLAFAPEMHRWAIGRVAPTIAGALATEALLAASAFLLPTIAMGALFTHLCQQARESRLGVGGALGVNTLGAAAAPIVFGALLAPRIGAGASLAALAAGYLVLASRRSWSTPVHWSLAALALSLALLAPRLAVVDVPPDGRLVQRYEGTLGSVSVVEDGGGALGLHINNRVREGSNATFVADARQALLPVLLHPAPARALFLGLGTGVTATAATLDPRLTVDAVELVPEVIAASAYFVPALVPATSRARLHRAEGDARRFVRLAPDRYDVIVADNFHPARSGSAALYTVEHFAAIRDRLAPRGLFCQWLPLHQLDLATLRTIVSAFLVVHPESAALLATNSLDTPVLGLVAANAALRFDASEVRARLAAARAWAPLDRLALDDELALLGSFVAGPESLARFAGDASANRDDRPIVGYTAPRLVYRSDSRPRDRLLALLDELDAAAAEPVAAESDPVWQARLAAYMRARRLFLEAGRHVEPTSDARVMLAQIREPLLAVLRTSPEFRPAYGPLLRLAIGTSESDPVGARQLLEELGRLQPERPEAAQALRDLASR